MVRKGKRTINVHNYTRRRPHTNTRDVHVHAHTKSIKLPAPHFRMSHTHTHHADIISCNPRTDTVVLRTEQVDADGTQVGRGKRTYAISMKKGTALEKVSKPEAPTEPAPPVTEKSEAERKRQEELREKKWHKEYEKYEKEEKDKKERRQREEENLKSYNQLSKKEKAKVDQLILKEHMSFYNATQTVIGRKASGKKAAETKKRKQEEKAAAGKYWSEKEQEQRALGKLEETEWEREYSEKHHVSQEQLHKELESNLKTVRHDMPDLTEGEEEKMALWLTKGHYRREDVNAKREAEHSAEHKALMEQQSKQ